MAYTVMFVDKRHMNGRKVLLAFYDRRGAEYALKVCKALQTLECAEFDGYVGVEFGIDELLSQLMQKGIPFDHITLDAVVEIRHQHCTLREARSPFIP